MTPTFSSSRLSTASECEYKYYLRYGKKLYPTIKISFFLVGTIVHRVIETFYQSRISHPSFDHEAQLKWCKERLFKSFEYEFTKEVMEAYKNYKSTYNKAIEHVLKTGTAAKKPTNSNLWKNNFEETFKKRADKVNELAVEKLPNVIFKAPLTDLYDQCERCLDNFVGIHQNAPTCHRAVIHEFSIDPPLEIDGHLIGGRIDRLDIKVNDKGEVDYSIYDYKTGKKYWKEDALSQSDQVCNYANAMLQTYGQLPTTVGIWDLLHNKVVTTKPKEQDIADFLERVKVQLHSAAKLDKSFEGKQEEELSFRTPHDSDESYKCKSCEYALDKEIRCKFFHGG